MKNQHSHNSRLVKRWRLFFLIAFVHTLFLLPRQSYAHQTPSTIVLLDISPGSVAAELQLPLSELTLAFGQDLGKDPATLIERLGPQLQEYLRAHIHPFADREHPWQVEIKSMRVDKGEQVASGPPFWELNVQLILQPPPGVSTRKFVLDYDVIMHQVINHAALVSIRNDWETGKTTGQPVEAGVIHWDMKDNLIYPFQINLAKGNWWKGFTSMLQLGMEHIREGTDHLLFLLVLLLPAMLLQDGKKWGGFGGTRYSMSRLLKIVSAFTAGHSLTLLAGALGWFRLPAQPVEILIAFSILVSAVHAVYPVFPGKEIYVAAGFGLVHGLAFASILSGLHLDAGPMALSILGFNLGIELMQLFVVIMIVPWLMLISKTRWYTAVKNAGALLAGIASLAWITERVSGTPNAISVGIQRISAYADWGVAGLAILSLLLYGLYKKYYSFRPPVKMLPAEISKKQQRSD